MSSSNAQLTGQPSLETLHTLRLRRLGIDTYREAVIYMRSDCAVCRSEGFEAQARVKVTYLERSLIATLNVLRGDLLAENEASLSEWAWQRLGAKEGASVVISHTDPLESFSHVRSKIYGNTLDAEAFNEIIGDVTAGRYSDIHMASFITACAGERMHIEEITALTRSMIDSGERLSWNTRPVLDKHCVGGLPGNRTTLIVVPLVAAAGLVIPKTSSRAITSPAGTADTMETLAPVDLDLASIRRVVDQTGGCVVWGEAARLSPTDDMLIRVERVLDLDSQGQLVASVLSKKVVAGSTHVVIDIPVGPTAKVRSREEASRLRNELEEIGRRVGLELRTVITDGTQPVGRGIGPALEAHDVLAVLQGDPTAPQDLHQRAVLLAGHLLELACIVKAGKGRPRAEQLLKDGAAWHKFQQICEAQGGMRYPPRAAHTHDVVAQRAGRIAHIDNRRLARVAKLAGAPLGPAAGVELHAPLHTQVESQEPLFTIHAESPGELAYALAYTNANQDIMYVEEI